MDISMTKQSIKILQLTDFHLFANKDTSLVGMNPAASLEKVMISVAKDLLEQKPDLVLITGDLSQDNSLASYKTAREVCSVFSCPIAGVMGNHDNPSAFYDIFDVLPEKYINYDKWRLILLNSHWAGKVAGMLDANELKFLEESLKKDENKWSMIVLHHHVQPIASIWLDNIALKNANLFFETMQRHKNVKIVLCGHVHQESIIRYNDIDFISTPSTSWQFARFSPNFMLDSLMPGYRWLVLFNDGSYHTNVVRIDQDLQFVPDLSSQGY